jgi:hypothetical protein
MNIEHPLESTALSSRFFVAYGFVPAPDPDVNVKIYCVLLNADNDEVGQREILMHPNPDYDGFWSVSFWGIPHDDRDHLLRLHDAATGDVIDWSGGLRLGGVFAGSLITWPPSRFMLTSSFTSYGSTDENSVSAFMGTVAGISKVNTAANSWSAIFTGLPVGTYELDLYDIAHPKSAGSPADKHVDITV